MKNPTGRTHCRRGHLLDERNIYWRHRPQGTYPECRTCAVGKPLRTELERFCFKSKATLSGCWGWLGSKDTDGYGIWGKVDGRVLSAHRWSYQFFYGFIPEGMTLDHTCRNRACVNPLHLRPMPWLHNFYLGEAPAAKNARKRLCIRGHEFDRFDKDGRHCSTCAKLWERANRDRRNQQRRNRLAGRAA